MKENGAHKEREMNAIVQLSNLSIKENISIEDFLVKSLPIIASGFLYPEQTELELSWNGFKYQTEGYSEAKTCFRRIIKIKDRNEGSLHVCSPEELLDEYEKQNSKNFAVLISRLLGQFIDQKKSARLLLKFGNVVEQSQMAIFITDNQGNVEYINPFFNKVLGYTFEEVKGKRLDFLFSDNMKKGARQQFEMLLKSGKSWSGEAKAKKENGEFIWTNATVSPIVDEEKPVGFVGLIEDISKRKDLEKRYRNNYKQYVKLADNIKAGLGIFSKDGICTYINKQGLINAQLKKEDILHKSIFDVFEPDHAKRLKTAIDYVVDNDKPFTSNTEVRISGNEFFAETMAQPVHDDEGNVVDVMFLTYDVTDYKAIEKSLIIQRRISQLSLHSQSVTEIFHQIFDVLLDISWVDCGGIYVLNEEDKTLTLEYHRNLSAEFVEVTKIYREGDMSYETVKAKTPFFIAIEDFSGDNKELLVRENMTYLSSIPLVYDNKLVGALNLASFSQEIISDNEMISIESIANVVANVIIKTQAYDLLKESNQLLERTVNELSEKHQLLIQKSKLESLGELSSGIAHEINQPLSIITMAIENIKIKWQSGEITNEYMDSKFNQIFDYIEKIQEIINHIRTFSRDQANVLLDQIDVESTIRKAVGIVNQQYKNSNISIDIRSENDIGYTIGSSTKLEQVFLNLFSNSRYSLEQKDKFVDHRNFEKRIDVRIESEMDHIKVVFKDNGTGIKEEIINKIFNPFFTTKPENEGTGLGLSIVYGIIKEMNGKIVVDSKAGEYTVFTIMVPRFSRREDSTHS